MNKPSSASKVNPGKTETGALYTLVGTALAVTGFALAPFFIPGWVSTAEVHTLLEAISATLAAFVGLITMLRYRARPRPSLLLVAAAFWGAAVLDAYHTAVTSTWFIQQFPSPPQALAPWSWVASRFYLASLLAISGFSVGSRLLQSRGNVELFVFFVSFLYLLGVAALFALAPLPDAHQDILFARPQELVPGLLLAVALVGYVRNADWRNDPFELWLLGSIAVGIVAQFRYMTFSSQIYDNWFDLAHGFKILSYLVASVGAALGTSALFKQAEDSSKALQTINASLEERVARRTKRLEEQRAELDRTNRDLSATNEQLQQANQELEQFAYIASHDLQEPLRMVAGFTNLLQRRYAGQLDEKADEYINYAVDGSRRMQQLINDLLLYSRAGRANKPIEPVDLNSVVREVLSNLSVAIREKNATVRVDPLPIVFGDAVQLGQVFQNLVGNGLKFTKEGQVPEISVRASHNDEGWQFSVRDNGRGFDPQYTDRVFVIFERLDRDVAGTGIGLPVCKKIVERHGGRMWVETQINQGATFHFTLPETPGTEVEHTAGERNWDNEEEQPHARATR